MEAINLAKVKHGHARFLAAHQAAADVTGTLAARFIEGHVMRDPGFTPRTGALQKATKARYVRTSRGGVVRAENRKPYAAAIDKGAKPHVITARRQPYLTFFWAREGRWVRTRSVNHPGNRPYRFLSRAVEAAHAYFGQRIRERLNRVARSF